MDLHFPWILQFDIFWHRYKEHFTIHHNQFPTGTSCVASQVHSTKAPRRMEQRDCPSICDVRVLHTATQQQLYQQHTRDESAKWRPIPTGSTDPEQWLPHPQTFQPSLLWKIFLNISCWNVFVSTQAPADQTQANNGSTEMKNPQVQMPESGREAAFSMHQEGDPGVQNTE